MRYIVVPHGSSRDHLIKSRYDRICGTSGLLVAGTIARLISVYAFPER
jgi:hypothetical protein